MNHVGYCQPQREKHFWKADPQPLYQYCIVLHVDLCLLGPTGKGANSTRICIISNVKVALHVVEDKLHGHPQSMQKTAQHIPRDCAPWFDLTSFSFQATKRIAYHRSSFTHEATLFLARLSWSHTCQVCTAPTNVRYHRLGHTCQPYALVCPTQRLSSQGS